MRPSADINHRLTNFVQTLLLFGGMLALLAVLGLLLAGSTGLLWASALAFLLLLFSRRVSPQFILRMTGARPLSDREAPGLYRLVRELAQRADLSTVPRLFYIPSQVTNAVTVGSRDEAAIGLTDTLLRRLDWRELTGVLAHEISHIRHNDTQVMGVAAVVNRITGLFSFFGQILLFFNLPLLLMGRVTISWLAILLLLAAPTVSGLLQLALSRTREFDADRGAVNLTGDPEGLASALQKLEYYQASLLRRVFMPGYRLPEASLFRTHPKTEERVRRLLKLSGRTESVPIAVPQADYGQVVRPSPRPRRSYWNYLGG